MHGSQTSEAAYTLDTGSPTGKLVFHVFAVRNSVSLEFNAQQQALWERPHAWVS
jgi:hypothetical protein